MAKGAEAFRSIGEVAKLIGVAPHVLRYWETQFTLLKPMKRGDGRRYYRPDDVRLAAGICDILRDEGLTIRGAKKMLAKDRGESVRKRGAAKLGEVIEAEQAAAPVPTPSASPAASETHHEVLADEPDSAVDAFASDDTDAARLPRSRSRKRPAARQPSPLPLFPDDAVAARGKAVTHSPVDAAQAAWLGQLTRVAGVLRHQPDGDSLSAQARVAAHRLLDAIADHY